MYVFGTPSSNPGPPSHPSYTHIHTFSTSQTNQSINESTGESVFVRVVTPQLVNLLSAHEAMIRIRCGICVDRALVRVMYDRVYAHRCAYMPPAYDRHVPIFSHTRTHQRTRRDTPMPFPVLYVLYISTFVFVYRCVVTPHPCVCVY